MVADGFLTVFADGGEDAAGALCPGADPLAGALVASISDKQISGPRVLRAVEFAIDMNLLAKLVARPSFGFAVFCSP